MILEGKGNPALTDGAPCEVDSLGPFTAGFIYRLATLCLPSI
jgi:hypothetical protein